MIRSISTAGDRLLGLFVPRVVAKADPCGAMEWRFCRCDSNYNRYAKRCCSVAGTCGACQKRGYC